MSFTLTILGSSSALPTSDRHPSAHVLNVHERFFLIDCGEGTQMQLRKMRFRLGKFHHILISHLHGDHVFGLYPLLSSFNLLGRKVPLHLYAPAHFGSILHQHLEDFDIYLNFELVFHPLDCSRSESIYEDEYLSIETLPLKHRVPTCGFLFREKSRPRNLYPELIKKYNIPLRDLRAIKEGADWQTPGGEVLPNSVLTYQRHHPASFAYCSDTAYTESFLEKIKGVDVLYHEATYDESMRKRAKETMHSTARQAAELARKARAGKLILGHFSARYKDTAILLDEAKKLFPNTLAATDGDGFKILPGGESS